MCGKNLRRLNWEIEDYEHMMDRKNGAGHTTDNIFIFVKVSAPKNIDSSEDAF